MSQVSVLAAVVTRAAAIADAVQAFPNRPDTVPWADGTSFVIYADAPDQLQQLSFGAHGVIQVGYTVHLDMLFGRQGMDEPEVDALAQIMADRMRAKFWPDRQLGGACFDSRLDTADDTLRTYRANLGSAQDRYSDYPMVRWRLHVLEHVAADASAAT